MAVAHFILSSVTGTNLIPSPDEYIRRCHRSAQFSSKVPDTLRVVILFVIWISSLIRHSGFIIRHYSCSTAHLLCLVYLCEWCRDCNAGTVSDVRFDVKFASLVAQTLSDTEQPEAPGLFAGWFDL